MSLPDLYSPISTNSLRRMHTHEPSPTGIFIPCLIASREKKKVEKRFLHVFRKHTLFCTYRLEPKLIFHNMASHHKPKLSKPLKTLQRRRETKAVELLKNQKPGNS
ncbi:unnamed protein product [Arabis nemorensis]|uniref:Uncharacterized protein n=1 Tax=Arabis nemorensis TaxID=586526 RepID=A0A565B8A7_9BRAS|nr:unnamed protein product [Arabis nemorensis]